MRIKLFFTILFLGILFLPTTTKSYSLAPTKIFLTAEGGTSTSVDLIVKNTEDDAYFVFSVLGMRQNEQGYFVFNKNWDSAESWTRPALEKIFIKKGEEKSISFLIDVPKNIFPEAHYLGLIAQPEIISNDQVGLSGSLATVLTLQIAGEAREDLSVVNWQAEEMFTTKKDWPLFLKIKNNSNIDVPLKTKIVIKNFREQELKNEEFYPGNNLLAKMERVLKPQISVNEAIFWPGIYKVELNLWYGRTAQFLSPSFNIIYFPIWSRFLIGGLFLLIILLGGFVFLKIKKRKNKTV